MAFLPAALAVAGAVTSAAGSIYSANAQGAAASYSAQVARNNAIIEGQNAERAVAAGQSQAQKASLKSAAQGGSIKASQAANGVDVNSGSAVDVQESQRGLGELDTETVLNNAQLEAYGYRTKATADTAQAQLDEAQAKEAPIAGLFSAGGTLLSKASSLPSKWG